MKYLVVAVTDEPELFCWSREWRGEIAAQAMANYMRNEGHADPVQLLVIRMDEVVCTFRIDQDYH